MPGSCPFYFLLLECLKILLSTPNMLHAGRSFYSASFEKNTQEETTLHLR